MSHPKPLLLTAALSATALATYGAYRLVLDQAHPDSDGTTLAAALPATLADALPDFSLRDLHGRTTAIDSWPGRPLVINFWATWCGPCRREIPLLKSLQTDHPELTVVGIAIDQPEPVSEFAADIDFNYPILVGLGDGMRAAAEFGIRNLALPATIFTAPDGATLGVHVGEIHTAELEEFTATLAALDAGTIDRSTARKRLAGRR